MTDKPSYADLEKKIRELEKEVLDLRHKVHEENLPDEISGTLLYALIQSLPLNIYAKSNSGHCIFANKYYCKSINLSMEEILHKTDFEIHPRELAQKYIADDQKVISSGNTMVFDEKWQAIAAMDDESYVRVIKSPVYEVGGNHGGQQKIIGTLGVFWDITEQKKSEIDLKSSEEKHRSIIESIEEGYFELDDQLKIIFLNDSLCQISGYGHEELIGRELMSLIPEGCTARLRAAIKQVTGKRPCFIENILLIKKDQKPIHLDLSLSPILDADSNIRGIRIVARDIDSRLEAEHERKKLESQIIQIQRMESIGTLAGGIAHDFNNILFIISGYTDIALFHTKDNPELSEKLTKIKESSRRGSELVDKILSFSRDGEKVKTRVNLAQVVYDVIKLLGAAMPANIEIAHIIPKQKIIIEAASNELHQVLTNLALNAGHAIGENQGTILFTIEIPSTDSKTITLHPDLDDYDHVILTISDTGEGIDKAHINKVFEPFFTTKKHGEGTGLGLSIVHGIITRMGGGIEVNSRKNVGTSFVMRLPLASKNGKPEGSDEPDIIILGNHENILFVDDEPEILAMMSAILKDLNYRCSTAKNGMEALKMLRKGSENFDCIVTDYNMPIMSGMDLSKEVLSEFPDIPIIICSGYGGPEIKKTGMKLGIASYLRKPTLKADLSYALHTALK